MTKITRIETIRTRADGTWLFVKVHTDQPGLYGIGSAERPLSLQGRRDRDRNRHAAAHRPRRQPASRTSGSRIHTAGYWRNDTIANTVQAGIDMALWDIKGKEAGHAGLPAARRQDPQRRRRLCPCLGRYADRARGRCPALLGGGLHSHPLPARQLRRRRLPRSRRCARAEKPLAAGHAPSTTTPTSRTSPTMFAHLRDKLGFGPKLTHDVHEHLAPHNAVQLAKLLEPYRLYLPRGPALARAGALVPTRPPAMRDAAGHGRAVHQPARIPAADHRAADRFRPRAHLQGRRHHPCRKIATLCEWFGVQTAWQEGGDNDPVNQMAAMHVDLASTSLRHPGRKPLQARGVRPVPRPCRCSKAAISTPTSSPGLGIDIDVEKAEALLDPEKAAKSYYMAEDRRRDGADRAAVAVRHWAAQCTRYAGPPLHHASLRYAWSPSPVLRGRMMERSWLRPPSVTLLQQALRDRALQLALEDDVGDQHRHAP